MDNEKIAICIPAYNPTEDLISLVDCLVPSFTVVVVNDGSLPENQTIFDKLNKNAILLKHDINKGKGEALKTGFSYILQNIPCIGVIIADADGQHLYDDIIKLANELRNSPNSLLLGMRNVSQMPFKSKFGNSITRFVFKLATKKYISDTQTGLRGIPYSLLADFIKIEGSRYEYEINMLLYCTSNNIPIIEIPITTVYKNKNSSSSFNPITDSVKIYKSLTMNSSIRTSLFYCISSLLAFVIDFVLLNIFSKIFQFIENADLLVFVSLILARIISSLFNFTFNKQIVFQKKNSNLLKELAGYYSLAIIVFLINYCLLDVLAVKLGMVLPFAQIIVQIVIFIGNYIIQKHLIFKKKVP